MVKVFTSTITLLITLFFLLALPNPASAATITCGGNDYDPATACPQGYQFQCNNNTPTCVNTTVCSTPNLSVQIPGSNIRVNDEDPAITNSINASASTSCSGGSARYNFLLWYYEDSSHSLVKQSETGWQTNNYTNFSLNSGIRQYTAQICVPNGSSFNCSVSHFYKMEKESSVLTSEISATRAWLSWSLLMNNYSTTSCNNPAGCSSFPFYLLVGTDQSVLTNREPTSGEQLVSGNDKGFDTTYQRITWYVNNYLSGDLIPDTTYYWRIRSDHPLINDSYFAGDTFKTLPPPLPTVTTLGMSDVTPTSVKVYGKANPNGATTIGWFRYNAGDLTTCEDSDSWGIRVPASDGTNLGSGTNDVNFSTSLTGLTGGQPYYYCAFASNSTGVGKGTGFSFGTPSSIPTVTTLPATINGNNVTLNGTVNPNGKTTEGAFEYVAQGNDTTCPSTFEFRSFTSGQQLGSGTSPVPLSATLTNVLPNPLYCYRAYGNNGMTVAYGAILSFKLSNSTPPPGGSPSPSTTVSTCGAGGLDILEGLLTTPGQSVSQSTTETTKCIIDSKAGFLPDDIPSFDDLKSLYYTQKK